MSFKPLPPLLERYVLRESILPFFLGFGLVTFLFILDFLFDFLDLLLAKDIPFPVVAELFVLALGWITALSFPCGVLVAALMTFGRLAQDNEVTAMRAVGVNLARVLRSPLVASFFLAGFLVLFNNYVLPESNHRFANLKLAIHRKAPAARIVPGVFIDAFENYALLVKGVNGKTGDLRDITIYDYSENRVPTTILAKRGKMQYLPGSAVLKLDLFEGEIHEVPGEASEGKYRRGTFQEHTMYLRNADAILQRTDRKQRGDREMTIGMMQEEIRDREMEKAARLSELEARVRRAGFSSLAGYERAMGYAHGPGAWLQAALEAVGVGSADPDTAKVDVRAAAALQADRAEIQGIERNIDQYKVEIQKKFSIPFACVVFVLVGGSLGIRTRKGGFANMAIAVAFFLVYYLFLIAGEQLADRRILSPMLAMWAPNLFFGVLGVYLTASVVGWGPSRGMR